MRYIFSLLVITPLLVASLAIANGDELLATPEGAEEALSSVLADGAKAHAAGDHTKAIEHFTKAVTDHPKVAEAHYNLAVALHGTGDHTAAAEHFKHALELGKDNPMITDSKLLKAHMK